MRSTWFSRTGRGILCATLLVTLAAAGPASAKPRPRLSSGRSGVNLFSLTFGIFNSNRIFCGMNNRGEVCVDPTNSPVLEGGFWPKGTQDNYIFNSGLQLAGTIPASAGFQWAGDTVGAFFMDPRGDQAEGDPITLVYNSLDAGDAAAWPNGAVVRDTAIYNPVILGRNDIAQQDLWVRTWDGNPAFTGSARTHPMGILVEERGLAWNFPTGNEDILYFVYTFYNVTASNPAVYANLDPAIQGEVAAIGAQFHNINDAAYGITIPANGYDITNMFAAFFMDPDVGNASFNYSTPVVPFAMGVAYKSDFLEPSWEPFNVSIFGPPFAAAPGFIGVKYLRSPTDSTGKQIGLTIFSNTLNSGSGYPDPVGIKQLYRYISGTSDPSLGDNPCTIQGAQLALHFCFQAETPVDTRMFQSSGPLTLKPGEKQTIVVAYINAAAVATPFLLSQISGDFKPGIPEPGDTIARRPGSVRDIEHAMGWVSQQDKDSNFVITQDEVTTVPRSLLNKALVAQAVYDNKFLLPFAPSAPRFFLIPGNNQVTVVWQKSGSETVKPGGGNPFFAVASDPTSLLYDPNFRQYDVEGYRVYRGRTSGALELVAQFDYAGTSITDYTGSFAYAGKCAPELGQQKDCPVHFPQTVAPGNGQAFPLAGPVVQVPAGGRVLLADSSVLILKADTAVTGGGSGFPPLSDNGVSFAFVDQGVRNSFTYFYAVTSFSVNSLTSQPSSLESPRVTQTTTPRASSNQELAGQLGTLQLLGADGSVLGGTDPTIDATTGEFSGPEPPADGLTLGLAAFLPQLLGDSGNVSLTIDSILPGNELAGVPSDPIYFVRAKGSGPAVDTLQIPVHQDAFDVTNSNTVSFPATNVSQTQSKRFGGDSSFALFGSSTVTVPPTWRITGWGRGDANADPANSAFNGPRWWSGAPNENTATPNASNCAPSSGGCVAADVSLTAGKLPGVDTLFHPQAYNSVPNHPGRELEALTSTVARAADFRVVWGANGAIDTVFDVTHKVPVPFSTKIRASWGILNDSSFILGGTVAASTLDKNNGLLTWTDILCVDPAPSDFAALGPAIDCGGPPAVLMNHARLSPIAAHASTGTGSASLTAGGNGFIFYLNGHFFLMQMASLPAAGTVWNARFYSGSITGTPGSFAFTPAARPPAVPGLRAAIKFTGSKFDPTKTTAADLARIHTVPDPYYVTSALEVTANSKQLKFVNMPAQAIVRIYSLSGILVQALTHNDPGGGGELTWNLRNRNNQFVASGVYFYHVETPDGKTKVGRFTVVNFAP